MGRAATGASVLLALTALAVEPAVRVAGEAPTAGSALPEPAVAAPSPPQPLPWDIPIHRTPDVQRWIRIYTHQGRPYFQTWLDRMSRYEGLIRAQLRRRGMPEDLVYVALIESGFRPLALSSDHATGLWQFMTGTARDRGLEVNEYVDERLDPIRSTEAALDYLDDLHARFGSWYLATAAYNAGPARVRHDLARYAGVAKGGSDSLFFRIADHLPRETREQVARLVAAAILGEDPARYGFHLEYPAPLRFEVVFAPGRTTLSAVAAAARVPLNEIRDLNRELVRGETPPGLLYPVRIPPGTTRRVLTGLSSHRPDTRLALAAE